MNIAIGITSFNRKEYLQAMVDSLRRSRGIERCAIRVYDDCSSDYDKETLRELIPEATEIVRRDTNMGSDRNIRQMYIDFLKTTDDVFVAIDSDLLFNPTWIEFIEKYFPKTDGIMSLYNSAMHATIGKVQIEDVIFAEKEHVGSAAVVMSRDVVQMIADNIPAGDAYDWRWSKYLRKTEKRLLVSDISYIQHVGLHGYNCDGSCSVEFGLNFYPEDVKDRKIVIDFFQELLLAKDKQIASMYRSIEYNLGNLLLLPIKLPYQFIKKLSK